MDILKRIAVWRYKPWVFVGDVFGVELTDQQLGYFEELGKLVLAKMKVQGVLDGQRVKMSEEDELYKDKVGISVMSGKGCGKDACLAWSIAWFLRCFPGAKFPMTGPSFESVRDILLAEFGRWVNGKVGDKECLLKDQFEIQKDKIFLKDVGGTSSFAKIRTSSAGEEAKKTLDGWHEKYMMVVVDEGSDVSDEVLKALDTTLTRPVNFAVMMFNPRRRSGFAYETQYGVRGKFWIKLHWDSRASPLVTGQQIRAIGETYGEGGAEYRINVMGLPPVEDSGGLIPYSWCEAAVDRHDSENRMGEKDAVIMGVDVAREGSDLSAIVTRCGRRVLGIEQMHEVDSVRLCDRVMQSIGNYKPDVVYIDTIGVGGPVYDMLKRYYGRVRPVNVANAARASEKFYRLRDELWWKLRMIFESGGIDIPNNRFLINEISSIKYLTNEKGQIKIESKKDMRKRGIASPNIADALMMTMMSNDEAIREIKNIEEDWQEDLEEKSTRYGWMAA